MHGGGHLEMSTSLFPFPLIYLLMWQRWYEPVIK